MRIKEIVHFLDDWAPPGAAWEKDNPGLQVGSLDKELTNILICLDVTVEVVKEAITRNCNFIISHHPLLYHSIKRITPDSDTTSAIISALLQHNITLCSWHTNIDFSRNGVSHQLAYRLGLQSVRFLRGFEDNQYKLSVFVPEDHRELVAAALYEAGAGTIGDYSKCSFRSSGTGSFLGSENSNPAAGKRGSYEEVEEVRLEVILPKWQLTRVTQALYRAHPYEEPAFDVYPMKNAAKNYGAGVIGALPEPMPAGEFLKFIKEQLNLTCFRYAEGAADKIQKVALCGGAGSDLLPSAVQQKADAFITADISYHAFHDAKRKIYLIDAGHFETEIFITDAIARELTAFLKLTEAENQVLITEYSTNPIKYFK
ncbi:MAG: Nif3-like dinuclear metal center hexameric protein [Ignavibacteria bacterium]|nr:Nif3-like dinuclear metal center hexameric protein [Ignavibacteria bacterium]